MATEPTPAQPAALQRALEWQVTFWSGEVTAKERAAFDHWITQSGDHARAWGHVQQMGARVSSLATPATAEVLRQAERGRRVARRRQLLGTAGVLAMIGAAGYGWRGGASLEQAFAQHRTGRGERREWALSDGTRLVLNAHSAVDLNFSTQTREVLLRAGEIYVQTAPDPLRAQGLPARPFQVRTRQGEVRAIGTQFTVRQTDDRSLVSVSEGAVRVRARLSLGEGLLLEAGQRTSFTDSSVDAPASASVGDAAWTRGLLVAERLQLKDVLEALGQYRPGFLRCDPAVQDLVVSGVYPLDDPELALSTLAQALPVHIERRTSYWVTVRPRRR